MKFFTPEVYDTFDDCEQFRAVDDAYRKHLISLRDRLPERVLNLADLTGIQDGLVVRVDHSRRDGQLKLVLRCGHLQMGYYNLELTYVGPQILPEHDTALAKIARSTKTQTRHGCDLAYHELDATEDGHIQHRLLFFALECFHPNEGRWLWFAVSCRDLRWRRAPRRTRRLPPMRDRYPGGPAT